MRVALVCLGGAVLSGILLVLAMPPASQGYLAWFAITPVLWATRGRGVIVGFLAATSSIFIAAALSVSGLPYALTAAYPSIKGMPAWTFSGFGIFGFAMAVSVAIAADSGKRILPTWSLAAVATLLESVLLFLLPANLGMTQFRNSLMLYLASIGGIWLVSYVVWFANFELAKRPTAWLVWLSVIAIVIGGRFWPTSASQATASFACLQTDDILGAKLTANQRLAAEGRPDLVVWPELSGIPLAPGGNPRPLQLLSAEPGGAPIVTSFRDDFQPLPHNAAALFTNGDESQPYFKRQLFGGEVLMHTAGRSAVAVPWKGGQLGLAICYDSCFPEAMRETARLRRVTAIALPTIDPESPSDFFAAAHAAFTPFRAAEENVAVIRADGNAYSMIVDAGGHIAAEAPPGEQILTGTALLGGSTTLYKRYGDWFLYACGALTILGLLKPKLKSDDRLAGREH
jgi:apolipoprotein N-acyltransferase